jgi:stage V sporulation protein G
MKIVRMNPVQFNGNDTLRAFFDVETNENIILKGFRLMNGSKGLFISAPADKGKDGKYYETVILPPETRNSIQKIAIEAYNK